MNDSQWASRKFLVTGVSLVMISCLPILYKYLQISDQITLVVIGAIATSGGVYHAFNTLSKKYEGVDDSKDS